MARPMLPAGNLCVVRSSSMNRVTQEIATESLLLNVAIIPPDHVIDEAIELSKKTYALGGLFELNRTTRFPHVTIFMARFSRSKIDAVREILATMLPTLEEEALSHCGYHMSANKYYEISYAKTPELERTQEMIARELRELRYAPGNPVIEDYFGEYSGDTKESAEEWGYDLFANLYRPHLTLTRFPAEAQIDLQGSLPTSPKNLSFSLSNVGLFRADDLGAARELVAEWKLGSPNP
jgi:hypothetical protein